VHLGQHGDARRRHSELVLLEVTPDLVLIHDGHSTPFLESVKLWKGDAPLQSRGSTVGGVSRRAGLLAGLLVAVVATSACGSGDDERQGAPEPAAATAGASSTAVPGEVPELLDFRAPLVGGGQLDSAALAGTPVVYWFWAPT